MSPNSPNPESSDKKMQDLMRVAGKRPTLDPAHLARARARVKREWSEQYQAKATEPHSTRWNSFSLLAAAALVTVVALAGWWALQGTTSDYEIHVEAAGGDAWVVGEGTGKEVRTLLQRGDVLTAGKRIETSDEGRVGLLLPDGRSLKLDRRSQVSIRSGVVVLAAGALYVDSPPSVTSDGLTIETALADFEEIGTQFEVRIEEDGQQASLRVREGEVRARSDSREKMISAGTQLTVLADGEWTERALQANAPDWEWLLEVLPRFDLEGRTAAEFLDWSARQLGVDVQYSDIETANEARDAVLSGSIEEVPLREALTSVLLTCNLTYRAEGSAIIVSRAGPPAR